MSATHRVTIAGNLLFVHYCVETLLFAGRYITWQTLPLTHGRYRNQEGEEGEGEGGGGGGGGGVWSSNPYTV